MKQQTKSRFKVSNVSTDDRLWGVHFASPRLAAMSYRTVSCPVSSQRPILSFRQTVVFRTK